MDHKDPTRATPDKREFSSRHLDEYEFLSMHTPCFEWHRARTAYPSSPYDGPPRATDLSGISLPRRS